MPNNAMIEIKRPNQASFQLTAVRLNNWFVNLSKRNTPSTTADFLAITKLFGLKDTTMVTAFLNSKEGQRRLAIISEQLAEALYIQEQANIRLSNEQALFDRMLAFLLTALLYRKEKNSIRELHARIQEQVDAALKKARDKNNAPSRQEAIQAETNRFIGSLDLCIQAIEKSIDSKQVELEQLDDQIVQANVAVNNAQANLTQVIQRLNEWDQFHHHGENDVIQQITTLKQQIAKDIPQNATSIAAQPTLSFGRHPLPSSFLLNLHLQHLQEVMAVKRAERRLYNGDGQEVRSFEDAVFALTMENRLVKDSSGALCLIGVRDDFQALDQGRQRAARISFEQHPAAYTLRNQIQHQFANEIGFFNQNIAASRLQMAKIKQDIELLKDQKQDLLEVRQSLTLRPEPELTPEKKLRLALANFIKHPGAKTMEAFKQVFESVMGKNPEMDTLLKRILDSQRLNKAHIDALNKLVNDSFALKKPDNSIYRSNNSLLKMSPSPFDE